MSPTKLGAGTNVGDRPYWNGTSWTSADIQHALLSAIHSDTETETPVAGDVIIANALAKWSRLAKGVNDKILTMYNDLPAWRDPVGVIHGAELHTGDIIPSADQDFGGYRLKGLKRMTSVPSAADIGTDGIVLTEITEAGEGKTVTAYGNAQIDTAQSKFGASGLFDGTGDYLSTPNSADFDFGTGNWTVDVWIRRNGNQVDYAGTIGAAVYPSGWAITLGPAGSGYQNKPRLVSNASGTWALDIQSSTALSDLTWTHLAIVRNGNTATMYLDGVSVGNKDVTGYTYNSAGTGIVVGRQYTDADNCYVNGWLDEFRISKGVARWTSNFTPPTAEYDTDAYTKLLLHMNGIDGSTTFTDSSVPSVVTRKLYANVNGTVIYFTPT